MGVSLFLAPPPPSIHLGLPSSIYIFSLSASYTLSVPLRSTYTFYTFPFSIVLSFHIYFLPFFNRSFSFPHLFSKSSSFFPFIPFLPFLSIYFLSIFPAWYHIPSLSLSRLSYISLYISISFLPSYAPPSGLTIQGTVYLPLYNGTVIISPSLLLRGSGSLELAPAFLPRRPWYSLASEIVYCLDKNRSVMLLFVLCYVFPPLLLGGRK